VVIIELLTPDEAAKILKVNVRTVTNLIRSGELKGIKVGRIWRIREKDLEEYISRGGSL
jgi:excisionase family DNA binding protein